MKLGRAGRIRHTRRPGRPPIKSAVNVQLSERWWRTFATEEVNHDRSLMKDLPVEADVTANHSARRGNTRQMK